MSKVLDIRLVQLVAAKLIGAMLPATSNNIVAQIQTFDGCGHSMILEVTGLGPLRLELEASTSGATAGDVNGDGTIDFDTFDTALQASGHRIIRHQVSVHLLLMPALVCIYTST